MSEESYSLGKSAKGLGKLCPILKDKHGNVIDGFHRQNEDPDWPVLTVESVDDPVKLELARLATNFCRRTIPSSEFQNRIAFLVKAGLKPEEIAEKTGIHVSTVYRHMPQELKDEKRSETIREGMAQAKAESRTCEISSKTYDAASFVECERCHVSTDEAKPWHDHNLCPACLERAEYNPAAYRTFLGVKDAKEETSEFKPAMPQPINECVEICGKCGREFTQELDEEGEPNLWKLHYDERASPLAELCSDCRPKLDAVINQFLEEETLTQEA